MRLRTSGAERERNCRNARKFGRSPFGTSCYFGALAGGNQTTDLSDFTDFSGRTPAAYLGWSVLRTEIFQNLFRIKQNLDVRLKAYLYFGSLFEREIIQKLNSIIIQKFIREHRRCSLAWGRSSSEKLTKIILKINQK